ncbi:OmpA family protein [Pseudomonas batumici]|uniref:OmpA family protein n=1 Tax=Pseudomonas batumici TaxID=226910 RepID=UPI000589D8DE|nr:OmpA family protein [Pseudomonas batumici]
MSSNKSLALAICLIVTGCAQTPQSADKPVPLATAVAAATTPAPQADSATHWWWPFGSSDNKASGKEATQPPVKAVPMPDPKITQAWLDDYEPRLRTAIQGSSLKLERRENVLVVIAPVDGFYNPKRPELLLPATLGPFTRIAKTVEGDPKTAVVILGHGDNSASAESTKALSQQQAQSVAAIFGLSGLHRDRLMLRGMGADMPRAANDSSDGRALNRRVEIILTPQNTMVALLSKYSIPVPPPAPVTQVAAADAKSATATAPAAKKTAASTKKGKGKAAAKKAPVHKKAPVKKAAATKAAADKDKAAAPAKKDAGADSSTKN